MDNPKRDVFADVTAKIVQSLENGVIPWRKTWGYVEPAQNHFSAHRYRGINALLMLLGDYPTPYFATLKQVNDAGGRIKKGSKSTAVYFRDYLYKDKNGKRLKEEEAKARIKAGDKSVKSYGFIRIHSLFNMADTEGLAIKPATLLGNADNQPIAVCRDFLAEVTPAPNLRTVVGDRASFNALTDQITMPPLAHFIDSENYYGTLFHELIHWTGHDSRLNRKTLMQLARYGDPVYSKEELTAEIGACFLCNRMGIETPDLVQNAASYISHWLDVLKKDKTFLWEASMDAQAAYAYLVNA